MSGFKKGNFVGFHRGEQTDALQRNHPAAFLLLCLIARRARYTEEPCQITGLQFGEAFIGDWKEAGLTSRKSYRCALSRLEALRLCVFRGAKTGANKGTVATLLPQGIFSIDGTGGAIKGAIEGPLRGHQGAKEGPQTTKEPRNQGTLTLNLPLNLPKGDLVKVNRIYKAYPKKVNKPSALKAISKALKSYEYKFLIGKTKAYAEARITEEKQFTPHPAKWFNGEQFNDDPDTWKSSPTSTQPSKSPVSFVDQRKELAQERSPL